VIGKTLAAPATFSSPSALVRRFAGVAGGYWCCRQGRGALALLAWLFALNGTEVLLLLRVNAWNRDLFDALERRDGLTVVAQLGLILVLLVAGFALASTLNLHVRRRIALSWRNWLAERLIGDWLAIGAGPSVVQADVDGRIAEDARIATEEVVELVSSASHALITLACFVGVLWTLSAHPPIELGWVTFQMPGYLLWIAIVYAGIGMALAALLAGPLVRTTDQRQSAEARYRGALVLGKAHAGLDRLGAPASRFVPLFDGIATAFRQQTRALGNLQLFGVFNNRLSTGLPLLVATPAYVAGVVTLGWVMQAAQAFQEVARALNWPVDQMARIAVLRASAERIVALHEAKRRVAAPRQDVVGLTLEVKAS
jgi:putative ATP-binding cassette transporter